MSRDLAAAPLLNLLMRDSADPVTNGQMLIYTLRIQNIGGGPASNVLLNLTFEAWGDNSRKVETNIVNSVIITPFIVITSPGSGLVLPFNVLSCHIAGMSIGLVGQLVYTNSWTSPGVSGMSAGTLAAGTAWSAAVHLPHYGAYTFVITGTNVYGDTVSDRIGFTRNRYKAFSIRAQ